MILCLAAGPLRELLSASACEMLKLPLCSGLPSFLVFVLLLLDMQRDFGNRSSDQKVRSLSCLCYGAEALCTLLI